MINIYLPVVTWRVQLYGWTKNPTKIRGEVASGMPEVNAQVRPGGLRYVICICERWLLNSKMWLRGIS